MAMFVHLAPEKVAGRSRKNGIRPTVRKRPDPGASARRRAVFSMPVTPNFYISHQWIRELKRSGQRTLVGVYFRVEDDEEVLVGHYGRSHARATAAEAARIIRDAGDARGYQVLILRRIQPKEIIGVRTLRQGIGWRYWPEAHGKKPCPCEVCQRGQIRSAAIRERGVRTDLPRRPHGSRSGGGETG
jgi:hypothetical protein